MLFQKPIWHVWLQEYSYTSLVNSNSSLGNLGLIRVRSLFGNNSIKIRQGPCLAKLNYSLF